jgi:hypothetical protein
MWKLAVQSPASAVAGPLNPLMVQAQARYHLRSLWWREPGGWVSPWTRSCYTTATQLPAWCCAAEHTTFGPYVKDGANLHAELLAGEYQSVICGGVKGVTQHGHPRGLDTAHAAAGG